jgi:hypothetical protein
MGLERLWGEEGEVEIHDLRRGEPAGLEIVFWLEMQL